MINYTTNSINPDGVRAQEIKESLEEDVQEELGHAQEFASRIKELYGVVPGSMYLGAETTLLRPQEEGANRRCPRLASLVKRMKGEGPRKRKTFTASAYG